MPDIAQLIQSGGNGWLYLPIAVLLGALHGLEPGHSKTMRTRGRRRATRGGG
jgi:nickel/cobalt exporter